MILLTSITDLLQMVTSGTADIDVHASFVDMAGATFTPGRKNTTIATATTTTVVASPAAANYRTLKTLMVRNRHAATPNTITVIHTDGTTAIELMKITLSAGEVLHYHESAGFWVTDENGRSKVNESNNFPVSSSQNIVVLSADVVNSNNPANTLYNITELAFSVTAGEGYKFKFTIFYTAAATATGSRWSINGPAATIIAFSTRNTLLAAASADGETTTFNSAYDLPAASNATSALAGNIAIVEGFVQPSANGILTARFASRVASSAITAKKGSLLEWYRVY